MNSFTTDEQAIIDAQSWNADSLVTLLSAYDAARDGDRLGYLQRAAASENGYGDVRTVPSFASMTPEEQARHLVIDHGFNEEEFVVNDATDALFPDRDSVIAAFVRCETDVEYRKQIKDAAGGRSFPYGMTDWHDGDHNGDGTTIGGDYVESGLRDTVGLHMHAPGES